MFITCLKNYKLLIIWGGAISFLSGCERIEREPIKTPSEAYKIYTGMDLPPFVSDFNGEHSETHNLRIAKAYFQYKAPITKYMDYMETDWLDKSESEANQGFTKYECNEKGSFLDGYRFWTKETLSYDGYACYVATYYPVTHYLHVNVSTNEIRHFVSGRDNTIRQSQE